MTLLKAVILSGLVITLWIQLLFLWRIMNKPAIEDRELKNRIKRNLVITGLIGSLAILGGLWPS